MASSEQKRLVSLSRLVFNMRLTGIVLLGKTVRERFVEMDTFEELVGFRPGYNSCVCCILHSNM